MTRNEMLAEIGKLRWMPYCVLDCEDMCGRPYQRELTRDAYDAEMRRDRPWVGDGGDTAYFNDEESEKLMDAYYKERERVRALLKEYNSTHKQQLKL